MGVNSLWDIVGPAARPVKLEALSRRKLAVDASIWIYQFLKAVRDKEGNSLGQTHIVGFFRRICKLLYFGILPLFVFDGGAPPLKRQTIQKRKERRQGNSDNAVTTAQKLLAIQVQRQAHDAVSQTKRRKTKQGSKEPEETVYLEDLPVLHPEHGPTPSHSPQPVVVDSSPEKRFVKRDEYHLPELKQFTVLKKDTRIMPASEFQEYADDATFDVVDGVEIDSVDPSSDAFAELPLATQYMILSHLRLRSRLRLGYTKDQLEELFPNSRDFSKFQIQQVQKRNFYTQRLMNVSGMGEDNGNATRRIAGDKDKHYALVNNGDGWTLSLDAGDASEPIELDEYGEAVIKKSIDDDDVKDETNNYRSVIKNESAEDSDDDLEDVPLGEDNSDDDLNKAVIESIYDQYKDDYEVEKESLQSLDQSQLKQAIELSKKEYFKQKEEEQLLQNEVKEAVSKSTGFDFGQSILFGSQVSSQAPTVSNQAPTSEKLNSVRVDDDLKRGKEVTIIDPEDSGNEDLKPTETPESAPILEIPWFATSGAQIHDPHSQREFYNEQLTRKRPRDDNEESGIISWSEARELIDEVVSDKEPELLSERESDIEEIVEINDPSGTQVSADKTQNPLNKPDETEDLEVLSQSPKADSKETAEETNELKIETVNELETSAPQRKKATMIDYDFEEQDEEELVKQLEEEETQHVTFTSQISANHKVTSNTRVTDEQLLQEKLLKAKRDADEVSETMISDVQELLKRFGIPYITAPMEAEAQCAELYRLGLVDGIVTDDSDCFLFGGSHIYKNMFNQKQYVECYTAEDIEHAIGLDNDKLIELALLLGSDYTEGIKGIGPVLAMEILAEFGNLRNFKKWFDKQSQMQRSPDDKPTPLEKNLLNRIKNGKLFLPDNFPDNIVKNAYTHADVDSDDSEFKWGVPSLDQIRSFLMYNVNWTQAKVDEVMIPLIRDMNKKRAEGSQSTIGEFFPREFISYKKEANLGKRMKVAANKLRK